MQIVILDIWVESFKIGNKKSLSIRAEGFMLLCSASKYVDFNYSFYCKFFMDMSAFVEKIFCWRLQRILKV